MFMRTRYGGGGFQSRPPGSRRGAESGTGRAVGRGADAAEGTVTGAADAGAVRRGSRGRTTRSHSSASRAATAAKGSTAPTTSITQRSIVTKASQPPASASVKPGSSSFSAGSTGVSDRRG